MLTQRETSHGVDDPLLHRLQSGTVFAAISTLILVGGLAWARPKIRQSPTRSGWLLALPSPESNADGRNLILGYPALLLTFVTCREGIPSVICLLIAIVLIAAGGHLQRRRVVRVLRLIDTAARQHEHWQREHERERVSQQRDL
jgi:hypothetical protein